MLEASHDYMSLLDQNLDPVYVPRWLRNLILNPEPAIFNSRLVCLTSLSSFLNFSVEEIVCLRDILGVIINGLDFKIAFLVYEFKCNRV